MVVSVHQGEGGGGTGGQGEPRGTQGHGVECAPEGGGGGGQLGDKEKPGTRKAMVVSWVRGTGWGRIGLTLLCSYRGLPSGGSVRAGADGSQVKGGIGLFRLALGKGLPEDDGYPAGSQVKGGSWAFAASYRWRFPSDGPLKMDTLLPARRSRRATRCCTLSTRATTWRPLTVPNTSLCGRTTSCARHKQLAATAGGVEDFRVH